MESKFYQDGNSYLFLTGESPRKFKNVCFVVWEGPLDQLTETIKTANQLQALTEVGAGDVPRDWWYAFCKIDESLERFDESLEVGLASGLDTPTSMVMSRANSRAKTHDRHEGCFAIFLVIGCALWEFLKWY